MRALLLGSFTDPQVHDYDANETRKAGKLRKVKFEDEDGKFFDLLCWSDDFWEVVKAHTDRPVTVTADISARTYNGKGQLSINIVGLAER